MGLFSGYTTGAPVWMVRGEFGDSLAPTTDEWGGLLNYLGMQQGGEQGIGVSNASQYYQATPISAADAAKMQEMISSNPLGLSGDARAFWEIMAKAELARLSAGDGKTQQYDFKNAGLEGSFDDVMSNSDLWNSQAMQNYASSRIAAGNKENLLGDLLQGALWVGGGALGINSLLGNGVSGLLSELSGGASEATLAAGDSMAGLVTPTDLSAMGVSTTGTGAGSLATDFGGFDGVTATDLATGGGTDVGLWDDTIFDGITDSITSGGSNTLDLGNLAAQDFADFGVSGVEALGDSLNYATTASDLTNGISWQAQLADVFRGMGLETNTALSLASGLSGDVGKTILKSVLGTGATTTGTKNLLSTVLSGLTGIYASQNKAQDLTEAAKYLTENSNPYRSYIKDGTVGGPGSVTEFMKGFQTPANNMATAASGYNDLLKTSYTDPLSIWNSPEMQGLNNIFKQQIDRRDSAAGRNSQYGARAVEMQNNFLSNALPKYRTGLNDALNTTSTAASNFGKVATPPGSGETSQNVGTLLSGAANSNNGYAGAVGSMLDQIFNQP